MKIYNRERDEITDNSDIFLISSSANSQWISLCGYYFLLQAENLEAYWYTIYYDSLLDGNNECVQITDKNLIGYVYCENILPALWINDDFLNNEKL